MKATYWSMITIFSWWDHRKGSTVIGCRRTLTFVLSFSNSVLVKRESFYRKVDSKYTRILTFTPFEATAYMTLSSLYF